jgi:hypothetical protein
MGGKASQAAPERPRRPLDSQIHQSQARRGWHAARRSRGSGLRLQKPHRHRPPASSNPSLDGHRCGRHDGTLLPELIDTSNTAGDVWADTAYRSKGNESFLAGRLLRSQIHRKKPKGKPVPRRTAPANARKSAVRAAVEHVFARQKGPMGLFIRTIGIVRARTKIGLANLTYNMQRGLANAPGHSGLTRTTHRRAGARPQRRSRQSTDHTKPEGPLPTRPENSYWRSPAWGSSGGKGVEAAPTAPNRGDGDLGRSGRGGR